MMSSSWYFLCDSDQHFSYDNENISPRKENIANKIIDVHKRHGLDFVISTGDATDHGSDGSKFFSCTANDGNEFDAFMNQYINPLKSNGIDVKLCPGNHDINKWKYPNISILKYIRDTYNATYSWCDEYNSACYKFIHKDFHFICMGLYPKNLTWLKKNLPKDPHEPVIIFYHYNTNPLEAYSDWWTSKEKQDFYDTIANYNIKLIINGHLHNSLSEKWRNIPNILCADEPIIVEIHGLEVIIHK